MLRMWEKMGEQMELIEFPARPWPKTAPPPPLPPPPKTPIPPPRTWDRTPPSDCCLAVPSGYWRRRGMGAHWAPEDEIIWNKRSGAGARGNSAAWTFLWRVWRGSDEGQLLEPLPSEGAYAGEGASLPVWRG